MARPEAYFRNNLGGTAGLLAAMEEAGVRRQVYSSSAAVYGTQERMPVAEDAPLRPDSPYGLTKRMGEEMCSWMARSRGWAVVSLRYFNPVGAHPSGRIGQPVAEESALVPRALRAILDPSEPLTVFGTDYPTPDGTGLRDFIHVSDLAAGHLLALNALIPGDHRVYNVGTGHPHSVREVLAACRRATGRDVPHVDGARRDGDIPVSTADAARFARDLGFRPTRSLDEMVGSTWRWIERNPRGYAAS
jgi:UDP-glucose 4-epimerase